MHPLINPNKLTFCAISHFRLSEPICLILEAINFEAKLGKLFYLHILDTSHWRQSLDCRVKMEFKFVTLKSSQTEY